MEVGVELEEEEVATKIIDMSPKTDFCDLRPMEDIPDYRTHSWRTTTHAQHLDAQQAVVVAVEELLLELSGNKT